MPVAILSTRVQPARGTHLTKTFNIEGVPTKVFVDTCSPYRLANYASLPTAPRDLIRPWKGPVLIGGNSSSMHVHGVYFGAMALSKLLWKIP